MQTSPTITTGGRPMQHGRQRFGVRARLALIIILLLAGVSGTQYLLNYQQQRVVLGQLMELNRQINLTVRDIDRQLKQRALESVRRAGAVRSPADSAAPEAMARELNGFIEYVDRNIGAILGGGPEFHEVQRRLVRLRGLALESGGAPAGGSSIFQVTASIMDEMSRRSGHWHYTISTRAVLPPQQDVLQLSIPIVEGGQVHFIHMQYRITDFLEEFRRFRVTGLLVTLGVLGVGLVTALLFSTWFTRPIHQLGEGFNRIERGELDCRLESARRDELGQLVAGFNRMAERLRQNKELEQSLYRHERLSSLGKLAAGIAHEIKNPLNAINLSLGYLGDKLQFAAEDDRELYLRYSRNIQSEVGRLSRIVDTFLSFSRMSGLEPMPVSLHELIEEVLTLLARDAHDRGVRIERAFAPGSLVKKVDPERMKTVLLNLMLNAIEAMPSGGRLRIETGSAGEGSPARITISDTGCGIPQENLERIFDLYFTTKEQGSGLGLSIVGTIVRDHGGEITVRSSLGTGSDFTVTLP